MKPFTTLTGVAAPLLRDNINTDQIAPVLPNRTLKPDYAAQLFLRWRRQPDGSENPDFVLNRPQYRAASILITGSNFGCGSARESAAWAIGAFGIRCIVARSFGELFRSNCLQNGILPVILDDGAMATLESHLGTANSAASFTVDLSRQVVICPDGTMLTFAFDPAEKNILLKGLDDIGLTLQHAQAITEWERSCAAKQPWLQTMIRQTDERLS
jgi:3-isopropylmalate dehydratase small subunit